MWRGWLSSSSVRGGCGRRAIPDDIRSPRRLDDPADWVRIEIETLLGCGDRVPVIPLLLGGADLPKAEALPSTLQTLPTRNAMNLRPYPDFEEGVRQVIEAIAKILGVTPQPATAPVEEKPPRVGGHAFSVTGKKFVGRDRELHWLDEAWGRSKKDDKINVVSLIGQGGEGKSAIVVNWMSHRERHGWQGARRVFEWSFYSQGTSAQSSASADDFFIAAFAWFDPAAEVPKDSITKGAKLADLIAAERTLLVLDGMEPLQQPPDSGFGGEFKDPAMKALLRGLARQNPGLCVLTSRTDITDLSACEHADGSCLRQRLDSLDPDAARALLRELGVLGPDRELDEAAAWFHRHAYDLNLLGNYLAKCTADRDIRGWQQRFPILKEDERIHPVPDAVGKRAGHGVRMLRAYERWLGADSPALAILRLLGLFDRPVRSDLLDELRAAPVIPGLTEALVPLPDDDWLLALDQLEQLALIKREKLSMPAGKVDVEKVSVSADEVSDELADTYLRDPAQPHLKNIPRAELKRMLAQALAAQKNQFAKSAERPRRAVTFALDTHPLLREHFAKRLKEEGGRMNAGAASSAFIPHPSSFQQGHRRLYAYLCGTTPDQPDATLEDLQPLYQAVAHGCQAGLQQEACDKVYLARILRGNENYSAKKLGAFGSDLGAIACFFEQPWRRISPALSEANQAWYLNEAAFRLRALGRLNEALEPMQAGLEMAKCASDAATDERTRLHQSKEAAIRASNLSELELTLGVLVPTVLSGVEAAGAVGDAEQSVTHADRSGDAFWKMASRATHADALHQAGRRVEAEARFREAEQMQAERQPAFPLLYSLSGFQYCDLLLTEAERAAWQRQGAAISESPTSTARSAQSPVGASAIPATLPEVSAAPPQPPTAIRKSPLLESCRAVSERGAKMFEWRLPGDSLLGIALDHLTLGRAALYAAILSSRSSRREEAPSKPSTPHAVSAEESQSLLTSAATEIDAAVSGLRRAGSQHHLPRGLLTRAWLRSLIGSTGSPHGGARTGSTDSTSSPQADSAGSPQAGPSTSSGPRSDSAQSDLDEAWEIAERGPMPLFLADIHLYRARLFGLRISDRGLRIEEAEYPWTSPQHDLAEARRLIVQHGYLRRMPELEDAERAFRG